MGNQHLVKQNRKHDDEYYTRYVDIENELSSYKEFFKGKIVYCPCDSKESNFVKYFQNNFDELGLKKLNFSARDFKSDKSIDTLVKSDIIVTNPPFSYIREFVKLLIDNHKKFIFIGSRFLVTYVGIFPYIKNREFWVTKYNYRNAQKFESIDGRIKECRCYWYTNLGEYPTYPFIRSDINYDSSINPMYTNYEAIEVRSFNAIPDDYNGLMGVPVSFVEKWNPDQFDLVDLARPWIGDRELFKRFIIKRKSHSCK